MMRRRSIAKPTLLAGCALGAWLALAPTSAAAQAFQGTGTVVAGSATIGVGVGGTSVLVNAEETVINWTPFDTAGTGTIDFMPAGTVALFRGGSETFTVLNRVIPRDGQGIPTARAISLNGTITSLRQDPVTLGRGNVWFYSPTGIIVGPTAVMNVGSLILTTNDIGFVPNSNFGQGFIYGPGGEVKFAGPADSTGLVEIQNGAQLNALGVNAYLALVAPRVVQRGTVTADGQVAYIAAEAVDMTINAGIFDFTVVTGTTDANGVVHTGTTTGPASTDFFADPQRIAMVAVPKNDALTMLLSGSIGYTPAASASNDGSSIVLSAGFSTPEPFTFSGANGASIQIGPATFRNPLTAWATDRINVLPQGGTTRFGGRTFLNAGGTVEIDVIEREFVIADENLILRAGRPGTGGTIDLYASTADNLPGGLIDVAGTLSADTSSFGILSVVEPPLDGQGGTIIIDADGGTISANFLSAGADGYGLFDTAQGGIGTGGTIDIVARSFGTIEAQSVDLFASGHGGYSSSGDGGDGFGGDITLRDTGGTLNFGSVYLGAHGSGGDGGGLAGDGMSGTAAVSITGQAQAWDYLAVLANAFPGRRAGESLGQTGSATGQAGASRLAISGDGALTLTSGLTLIANAQMSVSGQPGFTGTGGGVEISVTGGGDLTVTESIYADASALFSGEGIFFDPDSTPTLQGGQVSVTADGGTITAFGLQVRADAHGLYGSAVAGNATGGTVTVSALNGGRILLDNDSGTSLLDLSANGLGSPGPNASNAFGGTAQLIAEDGSITVLGDIEVSASGQIRELFSSPPDGPGHNATGGTATVDLRAGTFGTASIEANDLTINALGDGRLILTVGTLIPGGDPIRGDGGDGSGGTAGLTVAAGTLTVGGLTLDSSGIGGASAVSTGPAAWVSGNGFGGSSEFIATGGISNIVTLDILSNGNGGDGSAVPAAGSLLASVAGEGTGGLASLLLGGNGMLRVTDTTLEASGFGAPGMDHNGSGDATDGGIGTGGSAELSSAAGWSGSLQTATLALRGNGIGGVGGLSAGASATPLTGVNGDGGAGTGGSATIDLVDGQFSLGPVTIEANGTGGYSGDASSGIPGAFGGYGTGGSAHFALIDSAAGPSGARSLDNLLIEASGYGGFGSSFVEQSAAGQADLTVSVLDAPAALTLPGSLSVFASGPDQTAGAGVDVLISGAPLLVGGEIILSSDAPVTVAAAQRLQAGTFATLSGYTVTTTGLIQSGDQMFVEGPFGINADRLISGGTTSLDATRGPGPILVGDLLSTGAVTARGRSIDIASGGALTFTDLDATAGNLVVATTGNLALATADATGTTTLSSSTGSIAATGAVVSGGAFSATAPAGLAFALLTSGGTTQLTSTDGPIDVDSLVSSGLVSVTGRGVFLNGSGPLSFATAVSTGQMAITASGNLAFASVDSALNLSLTSTTGSITATGVVRGGFPNLTAAGNILIGGNLNSLGTLVVNAGGSFTVEGDTAADDAQITADQGITLASLSSGEITRLTSTDGDVRVANLQTGGAVYASGRNIDIDSNGSLRFIEAFATAGNVLIDADGLAIHETTATGVIDLDAGGLFTLLGTARGVSIDVISENIEFDAAARLGVRGTTREVTLRNGDSESRTYIGGAPREGDYSLDRNEAAQIFADETITILSDGHITIDDLALSFGAGNNIGAGGMLEISTPDEVSIIGDVALRTSGPDDTFRIDPSLIALDTETGSIAMTLLAGEGTTGGSPQGRLELVGDRIVAATGANITQLETLTDLDAITALLGQPGGTGEPLSAGTIHIDATDSLYIQNSGATEAFADRRGFAASGLEIATESNATRIAVNGRILTQGGAATGLETAPLVSINGSAAAAGGQFDPRSTINGCVIGADCNPPPEPENPELGLPTSEDVDPIPAQSEGSLFVAPLIELAGTEPLITPPLVDEPITGVGNDDLWEPRCDPGDEGSACPEDDGQP